MAYVRIPASKRLGQANAHVFKGNREEGGVPEKIRREDWGGSSEWDREEGRGRETEREWSNYRRKYEEEQRRREKTEDEREEDRRRWREERKELQRELDELKNEKKELEAKNKEQRRRIKET